MKKIALTLSAATLLLGALVGCGGDQTGTSGLGKDQRGFGYHQTDQRQDTGFTGQRAGEGPITDMFTRDDRRGARGLGRDTRYPATGLTGGRTTDMKGQYGATSRGDTRGAGYGGMTGTGPGAGYGAGTSGGTGLGIRGQDTGIGGGTGQRNGMRGTNSSFRDEGIGGAGIVGNRSGYVDDRGILRGRGTTGRAGIGGLGQTGRTLQDQRGEKGSFGLGTRGRNADVRLGDRITPDFGENNYSYPRGYDSQTVQKINTRLGDIENLRDSRVIVHDNRILVGVESDERDTQRLEQDIRRSIKNMAGDKEVIVVTERDQFNRIRTVDDRLRGGEAIEEIGATITEMFGDFGRAIQRPFERSR